MVSTCMYLSTYNNLSVYTRTYIQTCIYIYAHIHTYAYIKGSINLLIHYKPVIASVLVFRLSHKNMYTGHGNPSLFLGL